MKLSRIPQIVAGLVVVIASITVRAVGVDIGSMTWTPRSDWVNVKNCVGQYPNFNGTVNAVGDGTTDDTAALQSVMNYVGPVRGNTSPYGHYQTIYLPPGTYKISATLTLAYARRVQIVGCGSQTIIKWYGPTGGAMFNPTDASFLVYRGIVWDGNSIAGCGVLQCSIADSNYDGSIRHENESFRNFTQAGTYAPLGQYGNPASGAVPGAGIAGGFNGVNGDSLEADSMIVNCRFYNCTDGFFNAWSWGNQTEWTFDGCEIDNCSGIGIDFHGGGSNTVINTHFQNNGTDVSAAGGVHLRHCTSQNAGQFYSEWRGSYTVDSISDCWIDRWTNTDSAISLGDLGGHMVFDCTFTNPPAGTGGAVANHEIWQSSTDQLVLSNNYAPGLPDGLGLLNNNSNNFAPLVIPAGLRLATITSAAQTFLNTANVTDGGHIIDVTAAPYNADRSGGTDVTSALQSAVTAAKTANNGSVVYLPCGSYLISSALSLTGGNYTFQGGINTAIFDWQSSGSMLSVALSGAGSMTIDSLFMGHSSTAVAAVSVTATGSTNNLTIRETLSNISQQGNPWVGEPDLDSQGILFSALPSGTTVFLDHVLSSLNIQNSSAAQISGRFLQNGEINVSGTSAKTGVLGFFSNEGEATPGSSEYTATVTDNQNLVMEGWYDENNNASVNEYHLLNGSGTTPGKVVIQSFNHFASGNSQDVQIDNYSGLFLLGPAFTLDSNGATITQTGSNPVTMMFTAIDFGAAPTVSVASGATALLEMNYYQNGGDLGGYVANSPAVPSGTNMLSFASALDAIRQLDAVDLKNRYSIATDAPPIASYAFENNVTDQTATYNGTNNGATFADGQVGYNAASFDGYTNYITIPKPTTGTMSISMWLQTTDAGGTGQWYSGEGLVDGFTAASAADFGTALNGGKFSLGVGNTDKTVTSTTAVNDGKWHHCVATWNSSSGAMQVYVDGVLSTSGTGPTGARTAATTLRLGSLQTGTASGFYKGLLDQVQIYNYVLSATDVAYLYNHARVTTPIAAYWKLDESTGTTSADSSGNGVTGTWVNGPTFTTDHPSQIPYADAGSLTFNGTNQYVNLTNLNALPFGNAARTLSAWFKPAVTTGNHFIAAYGAPSTDNAFLIGMEGATLDAGGYNNDMQVPNAVTDTNWHLATLTYDGKTESLYLDGILKVSQAETLYTKPQSGYIGQLVGGNYPWQGSIDDVRVYNRCLTQAEVQALSQTNDLAKGFNNVSDSTANTWCYGTYTSLTSPSTFTIPSTASYDGGTGEVSWSYPPSPGGSDPNIEKNLSSSAIVSNGVEWLPGTVSFGPFQGPSVARFKAPVAGHYTIAATFQTDQIRGSQTSDGTTAYVYVGTTSKLAQQLTDPGSAQFGTPVTYNVTNVSLTAGQTVDFAVGGGAFTTQVSASVTLTGP